MQDDLTGEELEVKRKDKIINVILSDFLYIYIYIWFIQGREKLLQGNEKEQLEGQEDQLQEGGGELQGDIKDTGQGNPLKYYNVVGWW